MTKYYYTTRVYTKEQKDRMREGARKSGLSNKGNKRPDLTQRNLERDYSSQRRGSDGKFINTILVD